MKTSKIRIVWKLLKIAVAVYIIIGAVLYFIQERLLFHPVKLGADYIYKFDSPSFQIDLPVTKEKNLSIVQFKVSNADCKGVVLYFHGNRENINHYAKYSTNFTKKGYEVWMLDYPGFGKSTGKRTEKIMYNDALELYKMARGRYSPDSIIIYGKSIGTGVASQLASIRDCRKLLLETPYYSINALAHHYFFIYPVSPMAKYSFPNYLFFEKITAPITIFHGTKDEVIPYCQSQKLMKLKKSNIELIQIENGKHNNLNDFPKFHNKLDSVLRS